MGRLSDAAFGGDLFTTKSVDPPYNGKPPFQKHSTTSIKAAASIKKTVGPLHKKILEYLKDRGRFGATDELMQRELDMPANTQRPRRRELQLMEKIKDSGRTEITLSKRSAVVWILYDQSA